jgi:hypothetical protein
MQYFTIHANLKIHLWSLEGQHFVFDLAAVEEFGFGLFILTREIDLNPLPHGRIYFLTTHFKT